MQEQSATLDRSRLRLLGDRPVVQAVGTYLVVRAVGLAGLLLAAHHAGRSTTALLGSFDGGHYLAIARHGYDSAPTLPSGAPSVASPVFHPLFPALLAVGTHLWPGSDVTAGLLVTLLCGVAAAVALFRLGARLLGPGPGVVLVALWAALPHAVVGSMVYSENLFTALAALTLLLVLDGRWLPAALACALAGLTRPTGTVLAAVVALAALVALRQRAGGWRAGVCLALAPTGVVGYWLWVAWFEGRWDGYFWLQDKVWHTRFDGGADTWANLQRVLTTATPLSYVAVTVVGFVAVLCAVLLIGGRRAPWPVAAYAVGVLLLVLGTGGYYYSKGRLLVPDFPLLLPAAAALAAASRLTRVVLLGGASIASAWYGSYLLTVWLHSP